MLSCGMQVFSKTLRKGFASESRVPLKNGVKVVGRGEETSARHEIVQI
jgi:hypothetical protein